MTGETTLDYSTAVEMADTALTAIFDRLARPESLMTFEGRNAAGTALYDWLYEHPDVEAALAAVDDFEPTDVEGYIALHSVAWEIWFPNEQEFGTFTLPEPDGMDGGCLVRRVR
jgi:hypothetical protein